MNRTWLRTNSAYLKVWLTRICFLYLRFTPPNSRKMPNKSIFNRLVRCQEFKIISIRLEIRNQHVEMHQIPSMEEKSATSSAKPVSLIPSCPLPSFKKRDMMLSVGRYLAILGRAIRITIPSVTVAPTALVDSLIRSSNLPHSLQRGVPFWAWETQVFSDAVYFNLRPILWLLKSLKQKLMQAAPVSPMPLYILLIPI